jgi:amino acid adenylation domain-containing protein
VDQPDQTAKAFIPAPSWLPNGWGNRVYRTGDLARFSSDGQIMCLGRIDTQVKLHGVRIELSEIEAIACGVPGVLTAAGAVARRHGKEQLALLCELQNEQDDSLNLVRAHMARFLPPNMVPSILMSGPIQLTSTGKIDRKALFKRFEAAQEESVAETAWSSEHMANAFERENEQNLQQIWARVLGCRSGDIFASSDFFELGADSLDVIKLVGNLQRAGHKISYRDVYTNSTFDRMVKWLETCHGQGPASASRSPLPFELLDTTSLSQPKTVAYAADTLQVESGSIVDMYPCAHMQSSLITASLLMPDAYWFRVQVELAAEMDGSRVTSAWNQVVQRHPIMRTVIVNHHVLGDMQVVLDMDPLRALPDQSTRENGVLGRPLHKLSVFPPDDLIISYLVLEMHHVIYDRWVSDALMADLASILQYGSSTRPCLPFNRLIQYQQQRSVTSSDYWKNCLAGASITTFVSPAINASRQLNTLMTSCLEWKIPLRSPSTGHPKVSVATIVHCAYAMVVSCYSGSSDVCFPTIQSGRNIPLENVDQIIGPTMTSILFRTDCSGNIKVGEFLQTAQDYLLRACDHQQVPTRVLREALGVSGPLDMSCMLVVQPHSDDTADREPGADGFTFRHAEMHQPGSVLVEAIVGPGAETSLCLRYAPEILDESQAELLLSHLCNAITRLASCEGQERLQDMSVLSTLDDEIIARSCGATAPGSDGTTVTHMFRQAAARWPKAIAVDAHDCSLTFERLLYLAEQLAGKISATAALSQHSYLNPIGETSSSARGGEIRVAACASRGALAVLMQVATFLMPNTAFIPLDQGSPPERNAQILNDVEPDIILCSPETETCVRATTALMSSEKGDRSPTLVVLDLDTLVQFDPISSKQLSYAQPDHIAYILYTSGSSGAPKGVRMDHDPLATTIKALTDKKRVLQGARVLWSSPWTFDSHLSQVWEALTVGGTVCVPHETALHRNTEQTLASWTINHAFFTPNMAAQVDFLSLGIPQTLRTLAMGGEVIGFDVRPLLRAGICIVNEYGPSECAICVTAHVLKEHDQSSNNIGSPLPGNSCWVVQGDDPSRLAPVGTVGELAVGGTLARGYLNRPAQSAASFIAAPQWAMHATRRLYLTGDLVRLDTHGRFHYIGRKDSQIKINGVRIEVGEIEHRLAAIDPSTSVLVAAIDRNSQASGESGKSEIRRPNIVLVAFLGGSAVQGALAESEQLEIVRTKAPMLRARLAEIMPRTMLPRIWIPLAHPPQTRTGKVDRKALHVIFHDHMERHEETTSAATGITENVSLSPSERTMQALWADVLKCDLSTIGPMCDFFELGDSLHAIALVSAASRAGFALTAVQIFERPMLRDMALLLHQSEGEPIQHSRIVECDPAPFSLLPAEQSVSAKSLLSTRLLDVAEVEDVYKLTPCQMVSFLGNQKPHSSYYAWFLLKISGPLDAARLRLSCEETVHDHAILRTVFFAFEDSWYQAPVSGVPLNFLSLQWSGSRESVPDLLGSTSSNIGASFQCPTVFRLLQASKEKQLLAIGLSHAQYDGISISSIFDEIVTRYKANYFPPCPRPAFSRLLEYSDIQAPSSKAFWRKTLAGADMAKVYNRKSPSVQNASRDLLDTTVTRTISYRSSSVPKGTTFHDVLTLAWAVTLGSATGSNDVVFGSLSSGRNAAIENIALLPGPCITTVPVRVRLQQHSLHEALQALHSAHVEAMPHEHLGLREIVHHCTEWRSGTRFSTVIQHQNFNLWRGADDRPDSDGSLETGERVQFSNAGSIAYRGACDEVDLWVTTLPVADNEMRLQILFSENNMRSEVAQKLLDVLCHNMKTILSVKQQQEPGRKGYDDLGVLVAQSEAMLDQIRLPLQLPLEITPESAMAASAPLSHQGDDDDNCADTCLELEAESVTLGRIIRRTLHLPASAPLMRTTSLHDLGSDSVSLAVIATHLRQEGFDVSTSDLLRAKSLGQLSRVMSSGWRKRERKNVLQWDEMSDLQI